MRGADHNRAAGGSARARGFTLVELLVALTIFVTVMASVALVFNGAVRTSKQGFQNQEAFELARGAMKILERDLSRAFTNRDHGDNFSFYGTPIGFTYVGLISADESSAPNMSRVTYVIYHLDPTLDNLAGAVAQYSAKDGGTVPTYHLLRFIEPGADTLDSFPVPWADFIDQDGLNVRLQDVIDQRVLNSGCPDTNCEALVAQAAQRELWIKMLSGGYPGDPNDVTAAPIPSAWTELPYFVDRSLDPADYVVGEKIRFLSMASADSFNVPYCGADLAALEILLANNGLALDFDDIIYVNGTQTCTTIVSSPGEAPLFHDSSLSQFATATFSAAQGARPFFTYWDIGVITNDDPSTTLDDGYTADDQHTPVAFQFWNDLRNMVADGLDNDGDNLVISTDGLDNDSDGTTDELNEGIDELDEQYAESSGSPLDTRLPIAVTTDFTLFFQSPYPGAPDFNERFTQRIDLPTAYRRTFKNTAPVTAP